MEKGAYAFEDLKFNEQIPPPSPRPTRSSLPPKCRKGGGRQADI